MDVETEMSRLRAAGRLDDVASIAIRSYGNEVHNFIETILRDHADSSDAFAQACEDLWKGLPRFEGRASIKTWFYTLARHAALRLQRASRYRRVAPLSAISEVADHARGRPRQPLNTEAELDAIRDSLEDSDRRLLILRIDQAMSWNDVARVMTSEDGSVSDEVIARAAARLRKRFQAVKETLRQRALATGLMASLDPDAEHGT